MPVVYNTATLNNRLQQVVGSLDAATPPGSFELLDSGGNVLATMQLQQPAGTVSNAVLTLSGLSLIAPAATASGTARFAQMIDGNGNTVISGLVVNGSPTTDITMTPTANVVAGQTVALTFATITGT
jgi:uncharacterized membrane protein